jgi:transcriptional regulator with XRE-family HTH domain
MSIGLKFTKLIEKKNVRKTELSKFLGVARNTLDDYLSEKTYMTTDKVEKIAKYFKVPVGYFFDEEIISPSNESDIVIRNAELFLEKAIVLCKTDYRYTPASISQHKDISDRIILDYMEKKIEISEKHAYKIVDYAESIGEEFQKINQNNINEKIVTVNKSETDKFLDLLKDKDIQINRLLTLMEGQQQTIERMTQKFHHTAGVA